MAVLRKQMRFNLETKNIDQALTSISALTTKLDRVMHLFSEVKAGIVDLENDLNNIEINIVEEKDDGLGRQEKDFST